jgi:hypothetical protein
MRRKLAIAGSEPTEHPFRPVTCIACVVALSTAFWAGALWIASFLMHVGRFGY